MEPKYSAARCPVLPLPARAEGELAGVGLGGLDEFLDVLCRQLAAGRNHHGQVGHQRHGREVAAGVVGQLGIEAVVDGMGGQHHEHGVAIGPGARHVLRGQRAACAGLVLQHHGLAQLLLQLHGQRAAQQVGTAAGWIGNDQLYGLGRPGLGSMGEMGGRGQQGAGRQCQAGQQAAAREWVHGHGGTPFHEEDRAQAWYCSRSARLSTLPISLRGRLAASRSSATRWVLPTRAFSHSRSSAAEGVASGRATA